MSTFSIFISIKASFCAKLAIRFKHFQQDDVIAFGFTVCKKFIQKLLTWVDLNCFSCAKCVDAITSLTLWPSQAFSVIVFIFFFFLAKLWESC